MPCFYIRTAIRSLSEWHRFLPDFFAEFEKRIARLPPRELERFRRASRLQGSRLDATHPPTAQRAELLQAHPVSEPKIRLSATDLGRLEQELRPLKGRVQEQLIAAYAQGYYQR